MSDLYSFVVRDAQGQEVWLSDYRGKVLLIVNTATGCGFTPQYTGLEALYKKYREQGFEIFDFPCNQFGHEAPGSNQEIVSFCTLNYGTTFPQMAKIEVNGKNEIPLYAYLKSKQGGLLGGAIKWNFTKFLIDRQGRVVERFAPTTAPEAIDAKIAGLLD